MSDIRIVNPDGSPMEIEPAKELVVPPTVIGPVTPELELRAIGRAMGFENESDFSRYSDKLEILRDYAQAFRNSPSLEDTKWAIRDLEVKMGTPPFAEKKINFISQYAYLLLEEKRIKQERERFEKAKNNDTN